MASTNPFADRFRLTPDEERYFYAALSYTGEPGVPSTDRYVAGLVRQGIPVEYRWPISTTESVVATLVKAGYGRFLIEQLNAKQLSYPYAAGDVQDELAVVQGALTLFRINDPYASPSMVITYLKAELQRGGLQA